MNPLVRVSGALALAFALFAAPANAIDSGDIVVASIKGEVHVTMNGVEKTLRAGGVVVPPAAIRTGRDGAIELRQGKTSVSVGPDTQLEFPALEKAGGPIDRIVQPSGNAFYDIGKREGRRLRVETPYLVGVIKGTQFNVAAQADATTISLFEGRLEIRAPDESAPVVDLLAGNIAARHRGDKTIAVMKMDPEKSAPPARPKSQNGGAGTGASRAVAAGGSDGAASNVSALVELPADTRAGVSVEARPASVDAGVSASAGTDVRGAGLDVGTNVSTGAGAVDAGINAGVSASAAGTEVTTTVSVDAGAASTNVGTSVGVDTGSNGVSVGADLGTSASVGNVATVDTSVSTNVDVAPGSVSAGVDVGAAAGAGDVVNAGVGTSTAVDVGASTQVTTAADVSAGVSDVANVGAGTTTAVDVGTTTTVSTNVDASATVGGVTAGVTAGTNVTAGTVDASVSVGGVSVNVGLDLDLDGKSGNSGSSNSGSDSGSSNSGSGSSNSGSGSSNSGSGSDSSNSGSDSTSGGTTTTTGNLTNLLDSLLGTGKKKK